MFHHTLFIILNLASLIWAAVDIDSVPREETINVVPNAYIVQLSQGSLNKRSSPHDEFYNHLRSRGTEWEVLQTYHNPQIFVGSAIQVKDTQALIDIVQGNNVVAVFRIYVHDAPQPINPSTPSGPSDSNTASGAPSSHKMTGVDKLHAQGYKGKGIRIGIIDSGIDYNHPALGGGFGGSYKVFKGYDFVGDAFTGTNTPQPDNDPLDTCFGHGTGVAGVIAANKVASKKIVGVAPEAKIGAYRVFGCTGKTTDDVVVQALLRAYGDEMDVINLSLSTVSGWSSSVMSVVASNIAAKGVVVVATAGNNGAYGPWYGASPSGGTNVISVGSVESQEYVLRAAVLDNGRPPIPFLASNVAPNPPSPLPIVVPSDEFGCINQTNPVYQGKLVVLRRGVCAFTAKIAALRSGGAEYALVVNNAPGVETIAMENFPSGLIMTTDGDYLIDQYKAFMNGTASIINVSFPPDQYVSVQNDATAGLVSTFSTWGPSNDLFMKPNIMAPGGMVFTTWPTALGSWKLDSGTSLAAPLVSGCAALLLQAKGRFWQPIAALAAQDLFQSTAVAVRSTKSLTSPIDSLARQGTGLIQAYTAINTNTIVNPSILHLNDTSNAKYTHKIWVQHSYLTPQKYVITHVPSETVQTITGIQASTAPARIAAGATATFSKTTITVLPFIPVSFTVAFTPPSGLNPSTFPVYSGQIKITNEAKQEQLVTSYMGVAASMKDMKVLDNTTYYFGSVALPLIYKGSGGVQTGAQTYTFQGTSYPFLYYRLTAGSAAFRVDLVTADTTLPSGAKTRRDLDISTGSTLTDSNVNGSRLDHSHTRRRHHVRRMDHLHALPRSTEESGSLALRSRLDASLPQEPSAPLVERKFRSIWHWIFPQRPDKPGGGTPPPPGSFDTFPIVGELRELWYQSRNSADVAANNGYDALSFNQPVFANQTRIPNGSYRIYVRALRITGNPSDNMDYEHWLSPIINVAVP